MMRLLAIACVVLTASAFTPAPAPLHLLKDYPTARCLDGSSGAYYFRPAQSAATTNKWVFSLEGGGECVTESDCATRAADKSSTSLGSSVGYDSDGSGSMYQFQGADPRYNPDFYSWNHVLIMYCTGDLHLGTVDVPGAEQWNWAFFSGSLVVDAVVAELTSTSGLSSATDVIWNGASAGGIGAGASVDRVKEALPKTRVVAAPVAGFYWDNAWPYEGPGATAFIPFGVKAFEQYWALWKIRPPTACAAAMPLQPWACALLNFSLPYAVSDVFVIEMLVDNVQMSLHSGVPSYGNETASYVAEFGHNMSMALNTVVVAKGEGDPSNGLGRAGLFAANCFSHGSFASTYPLVADPASGMNASYISAFSDWYYNRGAYSTPYLSDPCCAIEEGVTFNPTCP